MRLLQTKELAAGGFELKEFGEDNVPRYAILSHTWGEEEVTFQDMTLGRFANKKGFEKIRGCCALARANGYDYAWVDTCCIDKTSSAELSEAINSMYRWYEESDVCYGFLADVPSAVEFSESRWFTRGWTLQELIAPETMIFLDEAWKELGTRESLKQEISERTSIPIDILSGHGLETASVAQKMSWAAQRNTSRSEDRAYCLMGIFGINMPLLYGEGERAFIRLQEEIMKVSDDDSIFAWKSKHQNHGSLLATSPDAFDQAANIVLARTTFNANKPLTVSNKGINLELPYMGVGHRGLGLAILHCAERGKEDLLIAIYLKDVSLTMENFERVWCEKYELINLTRLRPFQYPSRWINKGQQKLAPLRDNPLLSLDDTFPDPNSGLFDRTIDFKTGSSTIPQVTWDDGEEPPSLLQMAEQGRVKEAQWLLSQHQIKPDRKDEDGRTPLSLAAGKGHVKIVWLLLARRDVKPDDKDIDGRTPLSHAAGEGHDEVVWLLLTRSDVDMHSRDREGKTSLFYAAQNGHDAIISMILARGDVHRHLRDNGERTPLFYAAEGGHEAAVKMFLARSDMDSDARNEKGWSPLFMAAMNGHVAIAQILIDQGADIETRDADGQTPLWWATQNNHAGIVQLLLEKGVNMETKGSRDGCTPLLVAVHRGYEAIFQMLLDKGADIETTDHYGETPLLVAAQDGREAIARILVEKGAAIDGGNKQDQTPLWCAANRGHIGIMRLLLDNGADVNAKTQREETPLSWVVKHGQDEAVVELLLERGADTEVNAEVGQTPLYWAKLGERENIVRLLEKYSPHGEGAKEKGGALSKTKQLLRSFKS
ncbi:ankyrin repeat-containing [Trichoderma arundinaceum]|uniref:Ankyrin repeat-containing n=1 Tax=Trichoderma arundinaceum TaxID=490622 RepID=A0A395NFS6_TRIAR|nr:ankyrin repeat-containing [Trichoderma arundinaceum]